jgi:hypothetical protein
MNATNWIELAGFVATVLGGGTVGVAKLTRIAVAAENAVDAIKTVVADLKEIRATQQDHENRLNRAKL